MLQGSLFIQYALTESTKTIDPHHIQKFHVNPNEAANF